MDEKKLYERIILRSLIILISVLLVIYLAPKIVSGLLPIILALVLVALLNPFIRKIGEIIPIKNSIISYIVGTILLILILLLLIWFFQIIISQLVGLVGNIIKNWPLIVKSVDSWVDSVNSKIKVLPLFVSKAIQSGLDSAYSSLASLQKNAVNITLGFTTAFINTSNDLIFFIITFIVAFYIILGDMQEASNKYNSAIPEYSKANISLIRTVFKNSTWNYIKSQLKLALWCFILMAIVLKLLGQQYYIPIAILLGFVDLLPMIGPIIIMLPWTAVELFIFNNMQKGIGLFILLIFWTSFRQVITPKVIGDYADIHPILSVISLYAGLKLFGVKGAILAPILVIFIVGIYRSGILDNWLYDYKLFFNYIHKTLNINKRENNTAEDK